MIRAVLPLTLALLPGFGLADAGTVPDPRATHAGCTSPWLPSATRPAGEVEGAAVLRLALHSCVQDRSLPRKPRLRLT